MLKHGHVPIKLNKALFSWGNSSFSGRFYAEQPWHHSFKPIFAQLCITVNNYFWCKTFCQTYPFVVGDDTICMSRILNYIFNIKAFRNLSLTSFCLRLEKYDVKEWVPFCLFNEIQYPFRPKINNKKYVYYMYAKKICMLHDRQILPLFNLKVTGDWHFGQITRRLKYIAFAQDMLENLGLKSGMVSNWRRFLEWCYELFTFETNSTFWERYIVTSCK